MGYDRRGQMSKNGSVNRVPFISGSEYPDELHLLLKNEVMIRRLKNSVVKQLPPLRYTFKRMFNCQLFFHAPYVCVPGNTCRLVRGKRCSDISEQQRVLHCGTNHQNGVVA